MERARNGDTVSVHYTGKLTDGTVFDSSAEREPLKFTIGEQQVIVGFEQAIEGMATGEKKTVQIQPDQAYGPHHGELVFQIERGNLPGEIDPEVGQRLTFQRPDGQTVPLTVTAVTDSAVTLDANHPLAGRELTFDLELVDIAR